MEEHCLALVVLPVAREGKCGKITTTSVTEKSNPFSKVISLGLKELYGNF